MSTLDLGFQLPVNIQRTHRKGSVQLLIGADEIRLRVPREMPRSEVLAFVEERRAWIEGHLQKMAAIRAAEPAPAELTDGDLLWWRGEQLPIRTLELKGERPAFRLHPDNRYFQLRLPSAHVSREERVKLIEDWYQHMAGRMLPTRLLELVESTGLPRPDAVKIRYYKSRWGSCNQRGLITLNTALVMAPDDVVDYVLIHELCHQLELNHSPRYWKLVERLCPDWREHRHWLRTHGFQLKVG